MCCAPPEDGAEVPPGRPAAHPRDHRRRPRRSPRPGAGDDPHAATPALASWRPDTVAFRDPAVATKIALKSLARRILEINDEIAALDELIEPLVAELAPGLIALEGVGTDCAGQFIELVQVVR